MNIRINFAGGFIGILGFICTFILYVIKLLWVPTMSIDTVMIPVMLAIAYYTIVLVACLFLLVIAYVYSRRKKRYERISRGQRS